jgi:predicted O-methyltransferase YrrM
MRYLEGLDASQRSGPPVPRPQRLSQVPPEIGKFLAIVAAGAPAGTCVEIGTSAGYSTLWIALACRAKGRTIHTYELLESKAALARETFRAAGVEPLVELIVGDVQKTFRSDGGIAFCFLDAEKSIYPACYELVLPHLVTGGILIADNVLSHRETLQAFVDNVSADPRVDATVLDTAKGQLFCRKL